MAELRPGAALAASLQQTVQDLEEQRTTSRKAATAAGTSATTTTGGVFAPQLRRLEQQIEMERRQVERRLDKMERRIEEVASSSSSKGKWAELQGHVDGLEESLQNLIRGRNIENGQMIRGSELPSLPSVQQLRTVDELEDQMLQISHRLLRLEHGPGREESVPAPQDVVLKEMEKAMGQMSNFKGDWEEQLAVLEDQVGDLNQRLGELSQDVQELVVTREAQEEMEKLGQRTWQLTQKATSGQVETELRQEMGHLSEDLTSLFFRVEESEVGLYSLADAMNSICEELGRLKSSTRDAKSGLISPAVTQPQTPKGGFHGASVAIDPPS